MEVVVINYGCVILFIMVLDKDGKYVNVVFSYGILDVLMYGLEFFLSIIIGCYGNCIVKGKFILYGEEYSFMINNGFNLFYGGFIGFYVRVWDVE